MLPPVSSVGVYVSVYNVVKHITMHGVRVQKNNYLKPRNLNFQMLSFLIKEQTLKIARSLRFKTVSQVGKTRDRKVPFDYNFEKFIRLPNLSRGLFLLYYKNPLQHFSLYTEQSKAVEFSADLHKFDIRSLNLSRGMFLMWYSFMKSNFYK